MNKNLAIAQEIIGSHYPIVSKSITPEAFAGALLVSKEELLEQIKDTPEPAIMLIQLAMAFTLERKILTDAKNN